ncbi:MAG: glycoside hydrolase family protein [Robiginitomaculum sp.]|nr:glycoside hydrolase family protein [Robiginitomaculum sp.]
MTKNTIISDAGLKLVKAFEGFRALATLLPNGVWVIGYGHTVSAKKGAVVSESDAEDLLIWDMGNLAVKVSSCIFAPVSQSQMDALLSLAFNIGIDNFTNSEVVRFINEGKLLSAASAFDAWRKASLGGREIIIDALVRRRTAEKALFLNVEEGVVLAPSSILHTRKDSELECKITEDAKQQAAEEVVEEIAIDLSNSAALGSLLTENSAMEEVIPVFTASNEEKEYDYHFSDDDQEEVANANDPQSTGKLEEDELKATGTDELVPIGDVFQPEKKNDPVGELAEQISGRIAQIAINVPATATEDLAKEIHEPQSSDLPAADEIKTEPSADDIPPMPEVEAVAEETTEETTEEITSDDLSDENIALEEDNLENVLVLDQVSQPQEDIPPFADYDELVPENLTNELPVQNEQPFEVLEKRNSIIFVLMGIAGLILITAGVFGTQKAGLIVTLSDMVKGPGLAGIGILLTLVAVYFLLTKPKK